MDFTEKLWLSIIVSFILTFDHLFIPFILINPAKWTDILFYVLVIAAFIIQPVVIAFLPSKKQS